MDVLGEVRGLAVRAAVTPAMEVAMRRTRDVDDDSEKKDKCKEEEYEEDVAPRRAAATQAEEKKTRVGAERAEYTAPRLVEVRQDAGGGSGEHCRSRGGVGRREGDHGGGTVMPVAAIGGAGAWSRNGESQSRRGIRGAISKDGVPHCCVLLTARHTVQSHESNNSLGF